ncbi:MAG: condensation domain-containing protein [Cyanobacteria bacterium J06628_4]
MVPNQELYQRVQSLSPKQCEALAQRLGLSPSEYAAQLVAYVVSTGGEINTSRLRDRLKTQLPNYMVPAVIVPLAQMPRTANGKIDTKALPSPVGVTAGNIATPRTPAEQILTQIWSEVLRLETIGIYDNFFELGGDSILSIQIVSRAREAGLQLAPNQLFEQPTVAELAAVVTLAPEVTVTQGPVTGEVPLTPIQHWFFEQGMAAPNHWHQAMLVELPDGVGGDRVESAIAALWTHHDALRLSFSDRQINADVSNLPPFVLTDLSRLDASEQTKAVANQGTSLHKDLNLADGGLMRTALFVRGPHQPDWLLLSLHHLIVDAVSWQILLSDLSALLEGTTQLPEKTAAFKTWAETLMAQTAARQSEIPFWLTQVGQPVIPLPRDCPEVLPLPSGVTEGAAQTVTVALNKQDTQTLLKVVPAAYNTQINDALLTALAQTLMQWVGVVSGSVRVEIEAHGREQITPEIDVSRTVGWFTTTYPVSLQLGDINNCVQSLKAVKEQLRQIPDRGIGYGMLRYLGDKATQQQLTQASPSEILFNYLGQQYPTALRVIQDIDPGILRDPRNKRGYLLEINSWVVDEQLQVNWRYDPQIHRSETITTLAHQYLSALRSLISCGTDSGGFTPSDFPDAGFDQTELDDFIGQLTGEA